MQASAGPLSMLLLLLCCLLFPSSPLTPASQGVHLCRGAFTSSECLSIISLLKERPRDVDVREDLSVSRVNYFDATPNRLSPSPYDWIYSRVLEHAANPTVRWCFDTSVATTPSTFSPHVDFVLLHEFLGSERGFFDWHVDTSPNDGTGRTVNVNVMLSAAGEDYEGGGLYVGECDVSPRLGDLYFYPANFPHKVGDVTTGTRHTLVLAVSADDDVRERSDYWERGDRNLDALCFRDGEREPWRETRRLSVPAKFHMLRGEAALAGGREGEADEAFADAYAACEEAGDYARGFNEEGRGLAGGGEVEASLGFFKMAARIEPGNEVYRSHVEQVEEKLKNS